MWFLSFISIPLLSSFTSFLLSSVHFGTSIFLFFFFLLLSLIPSLNSFVRPSFHFPSFLCLFPSFLPLFIQFLSSLLSSFLASLASSLPQYPSSITWFRSPFLFFQFLLFIFLSSFLLFLPSILFASLYSFSLSFLHSFPQSSSPFIPFIHPFISIHFLILPLIYTSFLLMLSSLNPLSISLPASLQLHRNTLQTS